MIKHSSYNYILIDKSKKYYVGNQTSSSTWINVRNKIAEQTVQIAAGCVIRWAFENLHYINDLIHGFQQVQYHHNDLIKSVHWLALHYNNFQGVIL